LSVSIATASAVSWALAEDAVEGDAAVGVDEAWGVVG
jgi:hypothetical protein